MATSRSRRGGPPEEPEVGTTGRYLVLLDERDLAAGARAMRRQAGVRAVASASEAPEGLEASGADAIIFDDIGVAVVDARPDRVASVRALAESAPSILAVEPERYVYAIDSAEYARGYRDGVADLVGRLDGGAGPAPAELAATAAATAAGDAAAAAGTYTWGLTASGVPATTRTGRGIKLAVLDTGIDVRHPDVARRTIMLASFIPGQTVHDGHGHGTHCAGTAAGVANPSSGQPRYGVASRAGLHVGKVLSNQGSGTDQQILAGINWAINMGCQIISMSLGAPTSPGQSYSQVYEQVGRRALARGVLIVAAAGNESSRPFQIAPVGHPANCPSFMAVAAVDPNLAIASFSCGGVNGGGGEVNIAGPGVAVESAWPRPVLRRTIAGTSMATPHVAGLAALWAETDPALRGQALWDKLVATTRSLPLPTRDVGAGLAQAPL